MILLSLPSCLTSLTRRGRAFHFPVIRQSRNTSCLNVLTPVTSLTGKTVTGSESQNTDTCRDLLGCTVKVSIKADLAQLRE